MQLNDQILSQLKVLGEKYQANKIVLFGSRARDDSRERSDIDLAVYAINKSQQLQFNADVDEYLKTLLKIDIVHVSADTNIELLEQINKDGVVIYG